MTLGLYIPSVYRRRLVPVRRPSVASALPAAGFGADATGGEGFSTYSVTNTSDDTVTPPTNSLRWAADQADTAGGGIIDVDLADGSVIQVDDTVVIPANVTFTGRNSTGRWSVAGKTTWNGPCINLSGNNIIMEHVRVMRGLGQPDTGQNEKCIVIGSNRCLVRFCSFAWADDELFTIWFGANVTVQYCLFYEAIRNGHHWESGYVQHPFCTVVGGGTADANVNFDKCIYAHCKARVPLLNNDGRKNMDYSDIIVYNGYNGTGNWGGISGFTDGNPPRINTRGVTEMHGTEGQDADVLMAFGERDTVTADSVHCSDSRRYEVNFTSQDDWWIWKETSGSQPAYGTATPFDYGADFHGTLELLGRANVMDHVEPLIGAYLPSRSHSDARVLAQVRDAWDQVGHAGQGPDTPVSAQTNENPAATRPSLYATFADALTGPAL